MKRVFLCMIIGVFAFVMLSAASLAASYEGRIWTGKPGFLAIGYYCTAAQNLSSGNTASHWAWAKTYFNKTFSYMRETGNNRAVAKSGSIKPAKGEGRYGQTGWSSSIGYFTSKDYS